MPPAPRSFLVILGDDPYSKEQLKVCEAKRMPHVRGAIQCSDPENAKAAVCHNLPALPAFCDEQSHHCEPGLRRTDAELQALLTLPVPPAHTAPSPGQSV